MMSTEQALKRVQAGQTKKQVEKAIKQLLVISPGDPRVGAVLQQRLASEASYAIRDLLEQALLDDLPAAMQRPPKQPTLQLKIHSLSGKLPHVAVLPSYDIAAVKILLAPNLNAEVEQIQLFHGNVLLENDWVLEQHGVTAEVDLTVIVKQADFRELLGRLADPDERDVASVRAALQKRMHLQPQEIHALIKSLRTIRNPQGIEAVAETLRQHGLNQPAPGHPHHEALLSALLHGLRYHNGADLGSYHIMTAAVIEAVGSLGFAPPRIVDELFRLLTRFNPQTVSKTLQRLGLSQPAPGDPHHDALLLALLRGLRSKVSLTKELTVEAVGHLEFAPQRIVDELLLLLARPGDNVMQKAYDVLMRLGHSRSVAQVRRQAVEKVLLLLLSEDNDPDSKAAAVQAVMVWRMDCERISNALLQCLAQYSTTLSGRKVTMLWALESISASGVTGPDVTDVMLHVLQHPNLQVKIKALSIIEKSGFNDQRALGALLQLMPKKQTVKFGPGGGLLKINSADWSYGLVNYVDPGGRAGRKGVQVGWQVHLVDGQPYNSDLPFPYEKGFTVTFVVHESQAQLLVAVIRALKHWARGDQAAEEHVSMCILNPIEEVRAAASDFMKQMHGARDDMPDARDAWDD